MTTPSAPLTPEQQQPEAPAKKKNGLLKKIGGIVVAIIVAVAVKLGLPHLTGDAPVHAKAGECVIVTGEENDPKVETADCSSGKPDLYKVVQVHDNTFDLNKCGQELSALAQQLESDKFVLCLDEVVKK
ncbi:LppU/SCO3897 family protein [Streptomyces sp. NPDC003327]